jgi:hypothetical protein
MIPLTFTVIKVKKVTGTFHGGKKIIASRNGLMYSICFQRRKRGTSMQIIQM